MDYDPQGSSVRWVPQARAHAAADPRDRGLREATRAPRVLSSCASPTDTSHIIVDTPAALEPARLPEMTRGADKILVPVLPSDIDIHACSRCIRDLLLVAKIRREDNRIGVIANRMRRNTLIYQSLIRFLHTLGIPIVATMRDSQNYVRAAELGVGVHEMKGYVAQDDAEHWEPLIEWLESPSYHRPQRSRSSVERRAASPAPKSSEAAYLRFGSGSCSQSIPAPGRPSSCSSTRCRDCG